MMYGAASNLFSEFKTNMSVLQSSSMKALFSPKAIESSIALNTTHFRGKAVSEAKHSWSALVDVEFPHPCHLYSKQEVCLLYVVSLPE